MKSLFGNEIADTDKKPGSVYQSFKAFNRYRKSENKEQRCKVCRFLACNEMRSTRRYYKCKLMGCSCSAATDIRVGHVCDKFEREGL